MNKKKTSRRNKPVDRHLDIPSEANRDKHVNFVAQESGDKDPSTEVDSGKLLNRNSNEEKKSGRS